MILGFDCPRESLELKIWATFSYPVLILGEIGTGKELAGRSIHFLESRRNKPLGPGDCWTLVPTLIESELFG